MWFLEALGGNILRIILNLSLPLFYMVIAVLILLAINHLYRLPLIRGSLENADKNQ